MRAGFVPAAVASHVDGCGRGCTSASPCFAILMDVLACDIQSPNAAGHSSANLGTNATGTACADVCHHCSAQAYRSASLLRSHASDVICFTLLLVCDAVPTLQGFHGVLALRGKTIIRTGSLQLCRSNCSGISSA